MRSGIAVAGALVALLAGGGAPGTCGANAAADSIELRRLLDEFLAGAGRNDTTVHERFWADDLIYTGSSGRRVGKADILRDVRSAPPPEPSDPVTVYTAEDVQLRYLGDVTLVAFRLVASTKAGAREHVARFLNTGTFAVRDGAWQAVGWQATRLPAPAPEGRERVRQVAADFGRALHAADTTALAGLVTPGFVWADRRGRTIERPRLLLDVAARRLRAAEFQPDTSTIRLHGDAALVRGRAGRAPFALTLVNDGGEWRVAGLTGAGR